MKGKRQIKEMGVTLYRRYQKETHAIAILIYAFKCLCLQCMLSSNGDREENINAEEVAKKVKDVAKIIREVSSTARETVKKFHESGAIPELAGPFRKLQLRHKIPRQRLEIQLRKLETAM